MACTPTISGLGEALTQYKKAIKARPDRYEGYYFAGLVEERMGERAKSNAEADIRQALSLKPGSKDLNISTFLKRLAPTPSQPAIDFRVFLY
jgi:hypothetical protein